MGQFLGFPNQHFSLAANIRNLTMGYISPQYHLVFYDWFETVIPNGDNYIALDNICNALLKPIVIGMRKMNLAIKVN